MRLISCYIENFGKLHNISMEFTDGYNPVCEENGWGKSTLVAFIVNMLYGMNTDNKRSILENDRKRFKPWQGGAYGGNLTVEAAGKRYIINRIFGEKASQDTFELRDASTNMPSGDFSDCIGEELFGINRNSFLKTICIKQGMTYVEADDSLNTRIGDVQKNINETCKDDLPHGAYSYDTAIENLETAIRNRISGNTKGTINIRAREITECERTFNELESVQEQYKKAEGELAEAKKSYASLKEKRRKILSDELPKTGIVNENSKKGYSDVPAKIMMIIGIIMVMLSLLSKGVLSAIVVIAGVILIIVGIVAGKKSSESRSSENSSKYAGNSNDSVSEEKLSYGCDDAQNSCDYVTRIEECNRKLDAIRDKMDVLKTRRDELLELLDKRDDNIERLTELKAAQKADRKQYELLQMTKNLLTEAREKMTAEYSKPILVAFNKYLQHIQKSGDMDDTEYCIDSNLKLTRMEQGRQRDLEALSCGTRDLAGFCYRLAIIDALFSRVTNNESDSNERPFIILDDAFANLDDGRLETAMNLVEDLADTYQVINLTCSTARA